MGSVFLPPTRGNTVPFVNAATPVAQRVPWQFFAGPIPRGVNVYLLKTGVYTEVAPADATTIATVYFGGHLTPVSDAEVTALTAAGYGPNITTTATNDDIFGTGIFGAGIFGGTP